MRNRFRRTKIGLGAAGLATLAACGGGDDAAPGIETLGSTFQQAFAQGPNDTPVDVSNADLVLSLMAEPVEL